ncbi:GAF domain-containing protein [Nocardioides dongxiaopingii]|uniref:GAF domain-containing protein n=1 Tax=Nocardioides sp. S-1144 TaxID=2582905 RepID=UPI001C9E3FF5|nr:GAF domain-containing protein [Nocardioides sp. S-1144]
MTTHVYRAPMRSRVVPDDGRRAVGRALALGVVGVGGRLDAEPADLAAAVAAVATRHDERTAARLERFAAVPDGAEAWTRDADGVFHRGVLTGGWRHDPDPLAWELDLTHVRPCRWDAAAPPPAVVEAFARGGLNFQRVRRA